MKIIHTSASLEDEASGPSYSVPATVDALARLGHEAMLFSIGSGGEDTSGGFFHKRFENAYKLPGLRALSHAPKMKAALAKTPAEIFHTQGLWLMPNIYPSKIAKQKNCPFIITTRGMLAPSALKYSRLKKSIFGVLHQKRVLESATLFHATSQQEYLDIRKFGLSQPVLIAPNGIDIPEVAYKQNKKNGQGVEQRKKLLFFGRLHPIKGLDNLIHAWARVEDKFPEWDLEIRGTGDANYIASLNTKLSELGVSRVTIGGGVFGAEKTPLYRSAHLYILPSEGENFGITVAECLAAGTPVICSRGAPWSGLQTHDAGWWVNNDPDSLENCLLGALSRPLMQLEAMGYNGRAWMSKEFAWANIAIQLEATYEWLLGNQDKPANVFTD